MLDIEVEMQQIELKVTTRVFMHISALFACIGTNLLQAQLVKSAKCT